MASWACRRIWERITSSEWGSMPPVSASMKVRLRHSHAAKIRSRVTPGVSFTMDSRCPMSLLNNVDLPTLGRPTTATTGLRHRDHHLSILLRLPATALPADPRRPPAGISTRIDRRLRHLVGGGVVQEAVALLPEHVPGKEKNVRRPGRAAVRIKSRPVSRPATVIVSPKKPVLYGDDFHQ